MGTGDVSLLGLNALPAGTKILKPYEFASIRNPLTHPEPHGEHREGVQWPPASQDRCAGKAALSGQLPQVELRWWGRAAVAEGTARGRHIHLFSLPHADLLWLAFRFRTFTLANTAERTKRGGTRALWLAFRFRTFILANTALCRYVFVTGMLWLAFRFRTFILANTAAGSSHRRREGCD